VSSPGVVPLPGPDDHLAEQGAAVVRARTRLEPSVAVITGSGLAGAVGGIEVEADLSFAELPGFPEPTAPGHESRLLLGRVAGVPVAAFLGRIHFYEGHRAAVSALPVRLSDRLGARTLVVTASVGGVAPDAGPGSLVLLTDHINFMGMNPLHEWRRTDGSPAFVDLLGMYTPELLSIAAAGAAKLGIPLAQGVYAALSGPSYETPAEVAFLRMIGAGVVGMSVVTETIPAAGLGMRVLAICAVANAAGTPIEHTEVLKAGERAAEDLSRLLAEILPRMEEADGL